jgi:hypothetical protein
MKKNSLFVCVFVSGSKVKRIQIDRVWVKTSWVDGNGEIGLVVGWSG